MSTLGIIIAAGGASRRFGPENKLLMPFQGSTVVREVCERLWSPDRPMVLVVPEGSLREFSLAVRGMDIRIVQGSSSRAASVFCGLQALGNSTDYIAIHDASRPYVRRELLEACFASAHKTGAACPAHPVVDTIHIASECGADESPVIKSTPPRSRLWAAETPQVFRTELLFRAYRETDWVNQPPTDEASMVAGLGIHVSLVPNRNPNPKITYRYDLKD